MNEELNIVKILKVIEEIRKKMQPVSAQNRERPADRDRSIEEKREHDRKQAQAQLAQLRSDVACHAACGAEGLGYLNQILEGFGVSDGETKGRDDVTLYDAILPLCQLAYLFEQNGDAVLHAERLSGLCRHFGADYGTALSQISVYLRKFEDANGTVEHPLHDACLFDLPLASDEVSEEDRQRVARWGAYALPKPHDNQPLLLLHRFFREILPHIKEIEGFEQAKRVQPLNKTAALAKEGEIKQKTKVLNQAKREEKQLRRKRMRSPEDEQKLQETQESIGKSAQERTQLLLELAELYRGARFDGKNLLQLEAFYQKHCSEQKKGLGILTQNGLTKKSIATFLTLARVNDDAAIPNIFLSGEDLGYQDYYLKKLDITSDEGAALAACLGKITGCCQYLGGIGEPCTIHGISSGYGGFYVLCEKKNQKPSHEDKIMAQAWVWRSRDDALCFDSIEPNPDLKSKEVAIDMYRYLGFELCTAPEHSRVRHVNIGAQSGISQKVALKDYPARIEYPRDYVGYRDSKAQLKLADAQMPYLFYGKNKGFFEQKIKAQTEAFFRQEFAKAPLVLKDSEVIQRAIAFSLEVSSPELLACLQEIGTQAGHTEDLEQLIRVNRDFREGLNNKRIPLEFIAQGAYLDARNDQGLSALHVAVLNQDSETLQRLIQQGINLNIQDKYGNTPIITALECWYSKDKTETHKAMVDLLLAQPIALDIKDKDEDTPLIIAVKHQDEDMVRRLVDKGADLEVFDASMKTALFWAAEKGLDTIFHYLYGQKAKVTLFDYPDHNSLLLTAIESKNEAIITTLLAYAGMSDQLMVANRRGETPLMNAARCAPTVITSILEKIRPEKRLEALIQMDDNGLTVLHAAAENPEVLQGIFDNLLEGQCLDIAMLADEKGRTILHEAAGNSESLKIILALFSKENRLKAVMRADNEGKTVLDKAAGNSKSLRVIFDNLLEEQCIEIATLADEMGRTLLRKVARNSTSLQVILDIIPKERHLEIIMLADEWGRTLLHEANWFPDSFRVIFKNLPLEQRIELVMRADKHGNTFLHTAELYPELLRLFLDNLPRERRFEFLMQANLYGLRVWDKAAKIPEVLKCTLEKLSAEERLAAVTHAKKNGDRLLDVMAEHPESLRVIFSSLSAEQRLAAVMQVNEKDETVLRKAAWHSESLKVIFGSLSAEQRFAAVMRADKDDHTVLHYVAWHPKSLEVLLDSLTLSQRFAAVMRADKGGNTVLHYLVWNPKSLEVILERLPEEWRLEALKQVNNKGETVLDALYASGKHIAPLVVEGSFAPDYIRIDQLLRPELQASSHPHTFFSNDTPEQEQQRLLRENFARAPTFEAAKTVILEFLSAHQESHLAQKLFGLLMPGQAKDVGQLRDKWNLEVEGDFYQKRS
ncbi:MAG: ankyrin repeat domain-containing protein [Legionellaceae bacterium]|nr:ankyrin repeat domain-containing protein [Legionellaceae bacterium]